MKRMKQWTAIILLIAATSFNSMAAPDSRLMRFPDINGDLVAFVYAGDIWTVGSDGGDARRLTSHEGMELLPKISLDCKWIDFSGEYAGNRQIYVINSDGGLLKQLTWYDSVGVMPPRGGLDNVVMG